MDNDLQAKINILKQGYLKKLEGMILEFKAILEKISLSNIEELYSKVHTISGTSGMYGLSELSSFSTDFEVYLKKINNDKKIYNEDVLKDLLIKYIDDIAIAIVIKGEING